MYRYPNIICPVVMCGGNGTRLFPISNAKVPKQFISLGKKGTLLQETIRRVEMIMTQCQKLNYITYDPLLIMNKDHQLPTELFHLRSGVVSEDYANDTGVAVARAGLEIKNRFPDQNIIMIVFPADHYIGNDEAFVSDIIQGIFNVTHENIVLWGIEPSSPETKYGYILPTENGVNFKEKPNQETAKELIHQGALWNSGLFASTVETVINALPSSILDWIENPREGKAPSFDVAVLQEYPHIYAKSGMGWGWSDIGSFKSFLDIEEIQPELNQDIIVESSNVKVLNRSETNIIVIGCENLYVIANGNDLLIISNHVDYDNKLKEIANKLN